MRFLIPFAGVIALLAPTIIRHLSKWIDELMEERRERRRKKRAERENQQ